MVTVEIKYCVPCKYLPLALKHAEQLLTEFGEGIKAMKLVPGDHGVYDVKVGGKLVYSTAKEHRFPDYELLQAAVKKAIMSKV
jgi:selenoprotein W-related protein